MICKGHNIELVDSGIEWVGAVPATWNIFPAGGVFCEVKEKNTDGKYNNPFSFRYGEIVNKKIAGEIDESIEETLSTYRVVAPDTIMINGLNLNYDFISQRVAIVRDKGIITSAYLAVQPDKNKVVPRFVLYLLKAYDYRQVFHGLGSGIRKTLKYQDFKKIKIVAPSLAEQEAIVSYLDFQCEQIDCIISDAKASIEEYKSWRASIIYEAVTKGLDPDVEMKDSGVEWIGKIPSQWKLVRMKYLIGFMPKCDYSFCKEDTLVTFTPMECIRTGTFENRSRPYGDIDGSYTQYAEGDIVLAKVTPCFENGNVCIMSGLYSGVGFGSSELFVLRPQKVLDRFLLYFLQHNGFKDAACSTMTGTGGLKRVSSSFIQNCYIPYPDMDTQKAIADYLDRKCSAIQSLICEKESLIADLEAYKKSLIFEVVTGKRRVV